MTITKAIESAIKGGYTSGPVNLHLKDPSFRTQTLINLHLDEMLLDPKFWQALGKTMEWSENVQKPWQHRVGEMNIPGWHYYWLCMVDALAEDKTIEQYFETL